MAWYFELPWYLYVAIFLIYCVFVILFVRKCLNRQFFANYGIICDVPEELNIICNSYGSTDLEENRPKISAKRIAARFDYYDSEEYGVPVHTDDGHSHVDEVSSPHTCAGTHLNRPSTSSCTHLNIPSTRTSNLNRPTSSKSRRIVKSNSSSESDDGEHSFVVRVQINRSNGDDGDGLRPNDYDAKEYMDKSDDDNNSDNNRNASERISEHANVIRPNDDHVTSRDDRSDDSSCSTQLSKPKIVITDYSDKPSTSKSNISGDIYEIIETDEKGNIIGDVNKSKHVPKRDDICEPDNADRLDEITESDNGATENPTPVDAIKPDSISKSETGDKSDDVNTTENIIKSDKKKI